LGGDGGNLGGDGGNLGGDGGSLGGDGGSLGGGRATHPRCGRVSVPLRGLRQSPLVSAAIRAPAKPDALCAAAVDTARTVAQELAGADQVGDYLGCDAEGDRVVTHYFASIAKGYVGWRWAVTLARAARARHVTVDEAVLVPGAGALLAPPWIPWQERVQPGDLGPGDLLPTPVDHPRLVPGYTGADEGAPTPTDVAGVITELGLGRERVLSPEGRDEAAERWYEGQPGPFDPVAQAAPDQCSTCGFLIRLRGPLAQLFGVCANEMSPSDGRVVSFDHGCGAHSSVRQPRSASEQARPVFDTVRNDVLQPARPVPPAGG
jgi:Protein of unknown function (DUF3027)